MGIRSCVGIEDDHIIEFQADNYNSDENPMQLSLKNIEWDFEPENFAPPRLLKKTEINESSTITDTRQLY